VSSFVTVGSWKAFTCAVEVTDVHALNTVSILDFVAENMIYNAV